MEMIDILQSKISTWTHEKSDEFHQYAKRNSYIGKYIWEYSDEGFFMIRDICAIFFKNDGTIFKLTSQYCDDDWIMHSKLYERVINYSDCDIEIPIRNKKVLFNGIKFLYTEVKRPTNNYDAEIVSDAMFGKIDNRYMLDWVDHNAIIISHMKAISPVLPRVYPKRIYNGVEHSWIDFKKWEIPIHESLYKKIGNLYRTMIRLETSYGIKLDKKLIMRSAENLWIP